MSNFVSSAPAYEPRDGVMKASTHEDVSQGLREALERITAISAVLDGAHSRVTGIYPPPIPVADLPTPTPAGVIPEQLSLLQEVHLQLSKVEKTASALRNL